MELYCVSNTSCVLKTSLFKLAQLCCRKRACEASAILCNNVIFLTLSTGAPVRAAALLPLLSPAAARERDWCVLVQFYLAEAQQHATRGRACDEVCPNETPGIVALQGRVRFSVSRPVSAGLVARLLLLLMVLLAVRSATGAGVRLGGSVWLSVSVLVRAGFATGICLCKNAYAPARCGAAL